MDVPCTVEQVPVDFLVKELASVARHRLCWWISDFGVDALATPLVICVECKVQLES